MAHDANHRLHAEQINYAIADTTDTHQSTTASSVLCERSTKILVPVRPDHTGPRPLTAHLDEEVQFGLDAPQFGDAIAVHMIPLQCYILQSEQHATAPQPRLPCGIGYRKRVVALGQVVNPLDRSHFHFRERVEKLVGHEYTERN